MTDYAPNVYASVSVTLTLATLALVLRLIARRLTTAGYGYDDVLAVIAYFSALGYTLVALIWAAYYGLGRPIEDGPQSLTVEERLQKSWLMLWLSSLTYSFAISFSKFAILAFYWRIFKYSGIRIPIQVLFGMTIVWFLLRLFLVTLQCIPIQALWDASVKDANCSIKDSAFFFATGLTHVLIDIAILALPVIEVGKLHLPAGQKVAITALFLFGALVCIASIFVLVQSLKFNSHTQQLTLEMGIHIAWAVAEVNLTVISASLPMLRPIFRKVIPGSFLTSHSGGQPAQSITYLSKGIKLTTINKTKDHNPDGASSVHHLADPEGRPSNSEACGSEWPHGPQTTISSPWKEYASSRDVDDHERGMHMQNEIYVHIEEV